MADHEQLFVGGTAPARIDGIGHARRFRGPTRQPYRFLLHVSLPFSFSRYPDT